MGSWTFKVLAKRILYTYDIALIISPPEEVRILLAVEDKISRQL